VTPSQARILVADDEPSIVSYLKDVLTEDGYAVVTASSGSEACEVAEREQVHLALVDLMMPGLSGMEVLKRVRERMPATRVIIMTAFATVDTALEAMKQGALDYLIKPFSIDELKLQIRRALSEVALVRENRELKREVERSTAGGTLVGESPAFLKAVEQARKFAEGDTTVLILGETGTGKEMIAREIHRASPRKTGPFLALNCGALPESLLERELFGHEKGAFTGADSTRPGLLEAATDGTLLLDEIVEMPPSLQVKLLRILEGHEFMRLGGTRPIKSRVRFLAATNQNPDKAVAARRLREDLYFRINVVSVTLPPLRERGGDIGILARHFLELFAREKGGRVCELSKEALERLAGYRWPGNVRELRNVIERAVILCSGPRIEAAELNLGAPVTAEASPLSAWMSLSYGEAKKRFEKEYIGRALDAVGGNISRAAARTGLDRKNLKGKIREHGLKDTDDPGEKG